MGHGLNTKHTDSVTPFLSYVAPSVGRVKFKKMDPVTTLDKKKKKKKKERISTHLSFPICLSI